jgi:hypothetical protein
MRSSTRVSSLFHVRVTLLVNSQKWSPTRYRFARAALKRLSRNFVSSSRSCT